MRSIRVVPILAAFTLVVGLAACGGGGGPSDLSLTSTPTTATTTTAPASSSSTAGSTPNTPIDGSATAALPPYASLVARVMGASLAVFPAPNARHPSLVLPNPWEPVANTPSSRLPQILLVSTRRLDGWVKVFLPENPAGTSGWVLGANVLVGQITYRIQVRLRAQRIAIFDRGVVTYQGPIAVGAVARATPPGRYFLHRVFAAPTSHTTDGLYSYALIKRLALLLPLGTPVDVVNS